MDAFERFSQTLNNQTNKKIGENKSVLIEFGTVTSDFDLKLPRFGTVIPKNEYWIDKRLSIAYKPETEVTTSNEDNHSHTVKIPLTEGVSQVKAGDKVLVCWVGIDPVIVAVVVNGSSIGKGE